MSRPTKSAAESAEKPSIVCAAARGRKATATSIPHEPAGILPQKAHAAPSAAGWFRDDSLAPDPMNLVEDFDDTAAASARVVLDSNVLFDWLVFSDPRVKPVGASIESGRLRWVICEAMCEEVRHVVGRQALSGRTPSLSLIEAAWTRWATFHPNPPPLAPALGGLRCSDPDDQVFIDLAVAERAAWLLTRDRALLKLARRARPLGLRIATPEDALDALLPQRP